MSEVKYLYVRDSKNFPVGTFAYKVREVPGSELGKYRLSYAFSVFYMGDTYDKGFARDLTRGRLENSGLEIAGNDLGELVAKAVSRSASGVNYWSNGKNFSKLGHRFRSACRRTAKKLMSALKQERERELKRAG